MRPAAIALSCAVGLLPLAPHAWASETVVLERLQRIARGQWLPAPPGWSRVPYRAEIRAAAQRHGLSPSLLAAVVRAESGFDARAVSHAGAQGLGQLMPATARELEPAYRGPRGDQKGGRVSHEGEESTQHFIGAHLKQSAVRFQQ
ncbi:MAG: transglycosylase SLT domain-containing protein [candidate division NC10 bacterium]